MIINNSSSFNMKPVMPSLPSQICKKIKHNKNQLMYSTVLGISANSNYRPKSRTKKSKTQTPHHLSSARDSAYHPSDAGKKKERSYQDFTAAITPRSHNIQTLHSSPSQCSHSSDQNSLKSYREGLKSKKSIVLSTDSMTSDSRPSHRRSVTHCLPSDHSGSTPTNEHFNRLLLSQNPQHSSYGDELKTERRIFTAQTEQTPLEEESSAQRSPPQPYRLKQCFSQLKVEELSSPQEQDLSDLIPDFLQDKQKEEQNGIPLTSCFSYATLSHSSYKFKPVVQHPHRQEFQILPTPGVQTQEMKRLEQMRDEIAASKLVDRDRQRAQYKMKKRALNLSRSDLPHESTRSNSIPYADQGLETGEVTRRQSGPCFQKFVKNTAADITPRGMQSEGLSNVSTPSPFHTCKTTSHSGCSEFKFQPSGVQSRDVSPNQVRRSRLQTILQSKKIQCEEVKDLVRFSVQSVARMLSENGSRISRSRSLSTNGIIPSSSCFDISEDQKNQTIPIGCDEPTSRGLSFVNIRERVPGNGRYCSNEQPYSPYFKRAKSQIRCRFDDHPLSLSTISQEEKDGSSSHRAKQKRDINKKSSGLTRCKTMIKERVQAREMWKREEANPRKVRHMFKVEKKLTPKQSTKHPSPRENGGPPAILSRSSTPGLCTKKPVCTSRRTPKMKPEMREVISKIESTMTSRKTSSVFPRAKTPCVRKQLKGEKETALLKRGVGNASKYPHSFGKQDFHRREDEDKRKNSKVCSALQARKNFGKTVALRNYFLQTLKIPFRKFIRRLPNYEDILHFCYKRAVRRIERSYKEYSARNKIKRAITRYVREWRWKRRLIAFYKLYELQIVKIQRWVRRVKRNRNQRVHPLNIRRFKRNLGAVIKGWRVRRVLKCAEVQPLMKKVRETAQLMIDLRCDKSLTSRMFLRNVKRQHGPHVRQLIDTIHHVIRNRSWLKQSLKKSGSATGLHKKSVPPHKFSMTHQRDLSKYGVRDRSLVNSRSTVSRNSFQRAAVQRKSFKKKGLTLGKNMNELSATMVRPSIKSPKSPSGQHFKKIVFVAQTSATTPLTKQKVLPGGKTPKIQTKQQWIEREEQRKEVKERGNWKSKSAQKCLNGSVVSSCSESRGEKDFEIIGQISDLFSVIKTKSTDKEKAETEFNVSGEQAQILMEQLQNQLHKHIVH